MSAVIQNLKCPHCHSAKIVKNGKKSTGQQNYKCHSCGKQFQNQYFYNACHPSVKELMKPMLLRQEWSKRYCHCAFSEY